MDRLAGDAVLFPAFLGDHAARREDGIDRTIARQHR